MKHTYLFEEATWLAEGTYFDEEGKGTPFTGRTVIRHGTVWLVEGTMDLQRVPPVSFHHDYDIVPFTSRDATTWISENPALGKLTGQFAVVGAWILSVYHSEDGRHQGAESLQYIAADRYEGVGALFVEGAKLSSWHAVLHRES